MGVKQSISHVSLRCTHQDSTCARTTVCQHQTQYHFKKGPKRGEGASEGWGSLEKDPAPPPTLGPSVAQRARRCFGGRGGGPTH